MHQKQNRDGWPFTTQQETTQSKRTEQGVSVYRSYSRFTPIIITTVITVIIYANNDFFRTSFKDNKDDGVFLYRL